MSHRHYRNTTTKETSTEKNYDNTDDLQFEEFEFSYVPYNRMPPFNGPGFPKGGGFNPPNFNGGAQIPGQGFNPNGGMNQNMMGPPPNYMPSKEDKNVQKLSSQGQNQFKNEGPQTKAVSPNSISFCLYKYTYIWERNGRSYWTYLFNVDRVSVSGMRWIGFYWVYFGLDLRRIDSFVCYRNECSECTRSNFLNNSSEVVTTIKKEHTRNGTKTILSNILSSIDIPEYKNDLITETVGFIDDTDVQTQIPCIKYRNNNYKIVLEISYNDSIPEDMKTKIKDLSKVCTISALDELSSKYRHDECSILENFESSKENINLALISFENSFSEKLRELPNWKTILDNVEYSIKEENNIGNWIIN